MSAVNKIVFSSQSGVAFHSRHTARKGENAAADDDESAAAAALSGTQIHSKSRATMNNKRPMSTSFALTLRRHRDAQQERRTKALSTRRLIPLYACSQPRVITAIFIRTSNSLTRPTGFTFRMGKVGARTIHERELHLCCLFKTHLM